MLPSLSQDIYTSIEQSFFFLFFFVFFANTKALGSEVVASVASALLPQLFLDVEADMGMAML